MRRSLRLLVAAALFGCLACADEGGTGEVKTLRFTAIPATGTTDLAEKFRPVVLHLSKELGMPVEYIATADYAASVEAFINGDVHLAWFGGLSGIRARKAVHGARAIAQGKVDPEYRAYFIANRETGIAPGDSFPMAIRGRRFTFGSKGSTSGRLMPEFFIREHTKMSPKAFFGAEMSFSGSHVRTANLVQAGTFDAGAMDYKTYDRLVAEGRIDPGKCIVIWKTPTFADYNWTAHPDVDRLFGPGAIDRLQAILVGMKDPALLAALNRPGGLIRAANEEWEALARLAEELGLVR